MQTPRGHVGQTPDRAPARPPRATGPADAAGAVGRTSVRQNKAPKPSAPRPQSQNSRNPNRPGHHPIRLAAILLLATTLTACGWKLRGSYNLPQEIIPIAVDGGGVASELRDSLRDSNALARSADEPAASNVEILDERQARRVLTVDFDGKVDEYELRYEVRWQLTAKGSSDKSSRILVAPNTVRASRSYDYNASTVLSTNEQEARLLQNMRDDIAQRILFRLQSVQVGDNEVLEEGDNG